MRRSRLAGTLIVGIALGLIGAGATSTAASAHDSLVAADPAPGATVAEAAAVTLTFSADPLGGDGADVIQVKGPDGRYYETDCPSLAGPEVTAPVSLGAAGTYRVLWRIVSSDGHPVSGDYTFTYAPGTTATAPAAGAERPGCGDAAPSAAPVASARDGSGGGGLWLGAGIGAVVLVAVAAGAFLLIRGGGARE